ncbi:hypothetical protein B6U79_00350 [Candidatus Bathyarchaeota archaeon ex4484_231]|nr:MAG: hypothetical protein B6U79_00350 [Candidatus Bathyarchaeota archaeon ex4484_231]
MLLPERMSKITIICLQKDLDLALSALNRFGMLHVERSRSIKHEFYRSLIEKAEKASSKLDSIIKQLNIKTSRTVLFKHRKIRRIRVSVEDWTSILESVTKDTLNIEEEVSNAFKSLEEINLEIVDLEKNVRILEILDRFNINPKTLKHLKKTCACIAAVSTRHLISLERALSNFPAIHYSEEIGGGKAFVFVVTTRKNFQTVEKILKSYDVKPFPTLERAIQEPSIALSTMQSHLKELSRERESVLKHIRRLSEKYGNRILALREAAWNIEESLKLRETVFKTERIAQIVGYIPQSSFINLKKHLKKSLGERFVIFSNSHASGEDPPTVLRNPSFIKPFEMITKLYGLPKYDEVDPTPIMAVTFSLIFGLMFGDIGHGFTLFFGGLVLSFIIKSPEEWRSFCKILSACGFGAVIAGLLFGEAFGKHVFSPLWFDPFENVITFLVFSLVIGGIQITIGFIINLFNLAFKGRHVDAFTVALPKIILYGGAMYFLMECKLNFNLWLSGPLLYLACALVFLFFGKPIANAILKKDKVSHVLGERIFEGSELLLSLLGNTMSYSRILALLMAHWALLTATYAISSLVSTVPMIGNILELVIIVGGNIFVIAFEGLIVFIHTLRLHFYEWFSKFYEGTGTDFQPFKYQQRFTRIILKGKQD